MDDQDVLDQAGATITRWAAAGLLVERMAPAPHNPTYSPALCLRCGCAPLVELERRRNGWNIAICCPLYGVRLKHAGAVLAWTWYTMLQLWQAQLPAALDQAPATPEGTQQERQDDPAPRRSPARPLSLAALRNAAGVPPIDGTIERLPGGELVELTLRLVVAGPAAAARHRERRAALPWAGW